MSDARHTSGRRHQREGEEANDVAPKTNATSIALVELSDFSASEELLARAIVTMAPPGGTMFRGRRAECQVALALGATHAELGTSPWDLVLPDGRTIEVKLAGGGGSFSIGKAPRPVDLWAFVHVGSGEHEDLFTIVSNDVVDAERTRFSADRRTAVRLSSALVHSWGVHTADELGAALPRRRRR